MEHEDTSQQVRDALLKDPELRARVSRYVGSVVIEEFLNREHDPDCTWESFTQHRNKNLPHPEQKG